MTERFARERVRHELVQRELRVVRVARPADGFVRVTLGGEQLAGFTSLGPADHVKLVFPDSRKGSVKRDYTPLAFRETGEGGPELDIDFYLHGTVAASTGAENAAAGGVSGPAASWAAAAAPGDTLTVLGPRGSALPPRDIDELIVIADETAFPAVTRWLDAVGEAMPVTGYLMVSDPRHADYLAARTGGNRTFHCYSDADRTPILDELRGRSISDGTFCFLAGESKSLIPLRRYLRRELNLPKAQVSVHGYWKRGTAGHDHHAPVDPSDED